jgi:hypothetical protein
VGLTTAEGEKLEFFNQTANNIFVSTIGDNIFVNSVNI